MPANVMVSMSVSPLHVPPNAPGGAYITLQFDNTGDAPWPGGNVTLSGKAGSNAPVTLDTSFLPSIPAGGSLRKNFSPFFMVGGDYDMSIDVGGVLSELPSMNIAPKPTVSFLVTPHYKGGAIPLGKAWPLNFDIKNIGTATAPAGKLTVGVDEGIPTIGNTNPPQVANKTYQLSYPALSPGQSKSVSVSHATGKIGYIAFEAKIGLYGAVGSALVFADTNNDGVMQPAEFPNVTVNT